MQQSVQPRPYVARQSGSSPVRAGPRPLYTLTYRAFVEAEGRRIPHVSVIAPERPRRPVAPKPIRFQFRLSRADQVFILVTKSSGRYLRRALPDRLFCF